MRARSESREPELKAASQARNRRPTGVSGISTLPALGERAAVAAVAADCAIALAAVVASSAAASDAAIVTRDPLCVALEREHLVDLLEHLPLVDHRLAEESAEPLRLGAEPPLQVREPALRLLHRLPQVLSLRVAQPQLVLMRHHDVGGNQRVEGIA